MRIKKEVIEGWDYQLIQKGTRIHAIKPVLKIHSESRRFKGFKTLCGKKIEEDEYAEKDNGLPTCLSCLAIFVGHVNHNFWFCGINKHEWAKKLAKSPAPYFTLARLMSENLNDVTQKWCHIPRKRKNEE